jgi:hypothetical protein
MIALDASAAVDWLLQTSAGQSIEKLIYSRNSIGRAVSCHSSPPEGRLRYRTKTSGQRLASGQFDGKEGPLFPR